MKRSAKVRAAELVAKIEAAIEAGEFVPTPGSGTDEPGVTVARAEWIGGAVPKCIPIDVLPACGCVRSAASVVLGGRHFWSARGMTLTELRELERGYEAWEPKSGDRHFFAAGRELRKFHPDTETP